LYRFAAITSSDTFTAAVSGSVGSTTVRAKNVILVFQVVHAVVVVAIFGTYFQVGPDNHGFVLLLLLLLLSLLCEKVVVLERL
jgi:hypothetical protein